MKLTIFVYVMCAFSILANKQNIYIYKKNKHISSEVTFKSRLKINQPQRHPGTSSLWVSHKGLGGVLRWVAQIKTMISKKLKKIWPLISFPQILHEYTLVCVGLLSEYWAMEEWGEAVSLVIQSHAKVFITGEFSIQKNVHSIQVWTLLMGVVYLWAG